MSPRDEIRNGDDVLNFLTLVTGAYVPLCFLAPCQKKMSSHTGTIKATVLL